LSLPRAVADELSALEFFAGLSHADMERVYGAGSMQVIPTGTVLTEAGKLGQECYLILDGEVSVELPDREVVLSRGQLVGEMAMLDYNRRTASCRVKSDLRALVINRHYFDQVIRDYPVLMQRIYAEVARKLADSGSISVSGG
jgi:CRP-like cAMP-binding protein